MLLAQVATTSRAIADTAARKKKVSLLSALLREVPAEERAPVARYLAGETGHKTGIGYATVGELRSVTPAASPSLTITSVEQVFAELPTLAGTGSSRAKRDALGALFARATEIEQHFLSAILVGELRQGALDALVVDAIALTAELPVKAVRTAYMLAGELGVVAAAVLADPASVHAFGLTLFRPILPMLAQTAEDAASALAEFPDAPLAFELKLDGFRLQIHKDGDAIRAYSRALNDVTAEIGPLLDVVRALPARRLILDAEAIAYRANGRPLPFQDTMKLKAGGTSLTLSAFDVLLVDGDTLMTKPAQERFAALASAAPTLAVPRVITADAAEATAFYDRAIAGGHEGVMAKALDAPYDAGSRGAAWLKIKKVRHLDLVVLAAEWGSGRRKGKLSNIHIGARTHDGDNFVMLGKTFKGMTDAMLDWQTANFLARQVDRDGHVIYVRPEIVVEIAFNDVLRSTQYKGGMALRHARVVRYREDKTVAESDSVEAVRAIAIADGVFD